MGTLPSIENESVCACMFLKYENRWLFKQGHVSPRKRIQNSVRRTFINLCQTFIWRIGLTLFLKVFQWPLWSDGMSCVIANCHYYISVLTGAIRKTPTVKSDRFLEEEKPQKPTRWEKTAILLYLYVAKNQAMVWNSRMYEWRCACKAWIISQGQKQRQTPKNKISYTCTPTLGIP